MHNSTELTKTAGQQTGCQDQAASDDWQEQELTSASSEIAAECRLRPEPRHSLAEQLVYGLFECPHAMHLRLPLGVQRFDSYDYFSELLYTSSLLHFSDPQYLASHFEAALAADPELRQGTWHLVDPNTVIAQPGVRRYRHLAEDKISEGVFIYQFLSDHWHGAVAKQNFYPSCIAPHLRETPASSPIEWAVERMRIVNGYVAEMAGRDYPPLFAEFAYTKLARLVGNLAPLALATQREYRLSAEQKTLLSEAISLYGIDMPSEAVIFIIENSEYLSLADLHTEAIHNFITALPAALKNGLIIDRVTELLRYNITGTSTTEDAIDHTLKVVASIYTGLENAPWWFKEDFEMRMEVQLQGPESHFPHKETELLAKEAGFAFQYAYEVYLKTGRRLVSEADIAPEAAIKFTCDITKSYGIGNPSRACNVLEFAVELLKEVAPDDREKSLSMLFSTLERYKPASEIVGVLEGSEVNFTKPGLINIASSLLGTTRLEDEQLDSVTLQPAHVRDVVTQCSRPLLERAMIRPPVAEEFLDSRLLTCQLDTGAVALPLPAQTAGQPQVSSPLFSWVDFEHRLHSECAFDREKVAKIYFTFCANKLANPFSPPPGFLAFLQKFEQIPDPNYRFPYLEAPEDRPAISRKNAENALQRYLMISTLLDSWVMGMVSWQELERVFNWLTEEISEEKRKEFEVEQCWEDARCYRDSGDSAESSQARDDSFLVHRVDSDVSEYEHAQQSSRLTTLRDNIYIVSLLNSAAIACGSTVPTLSAAVSTTFASLIDGSITGFALKDTDTRAAASAAPFEFNELRKLGIIDQAALEREAAALQTGNKEAFFSKLQALPQLVKTAKVEIEKSVRTVLLWGGQTSILAACTQTREELLRNIKGSLEKSSLLTADAPEKLVSALFDWISDYVNLVENVSHFKRNNLSALARRGAPAANYREHSAVSQANDIVACSWYFLTTLRGAEWPALSQSRVAANDLALRCAVSRRQEPEVPFEAVKERIIEMRRLHFGLLPVGGKIHVLHEMNAERFELLQSCLGFDSTSFKLIHANRSLILPPLPSSSELAFLAKMLDVERIIDWDHPELQISIPGRLAPSACAILGAAVLLATEEGVRYDENFFCTSHNDKTGYRIMSYDADGPRLEFPFSTTLPGRTDILGRRHLRDIERYQLLGTVLVHGQCGGEFAHLAGSFSDKFTEILSRHGLVQVLSESWIHTRERPESEDAGRKHYFNAVKPCTDAWFACHESFLKMGRIEGVVAEMQSLFDWLENEVRVVQNRMLNDEKYQRERELLFSI